MRNPHRVEEYARGRRSVGIAICRDNIWMGVASYYSEKSSLCPSKEDPEPCKPSLLFLRSSLSLSFLYPLFFSRFVDATKEIGKLDQFRWRNLDYRFNDTREAYSIGAHYFSCISTVLSANFLSVTISIIDSSGTHEVHALRNIFPFHWCVVFQCLLFFPDLQTSRPRQSDRDSLI